jgi:hypothetical protein
VLGKALGQVLDKNKGTEGKTDEVLNFIKALVHKFYMVQNLGIILLKIIFPMIPGKCPLDTQRVS